MKILSFPASNSRHSINRELLHYAERFLKAHDIEHLDIHDYEMPIYSVDRERETGVPDAAKRFLRKIAEADGLLISFAEHNGNYTAAFKNLSDWCSRIDRNIYQHKKMVLLSASPGQGGASTVLAMAESSVPFFGGDVVASLSIPSFHENFDSEAGVLTNEVLADKLEKAMAQLDEAITANQ